jgi:hypothetical protein
MCRQRLGGERRLGVPRNGVLAMTDFDEFRRGDVKHLNATLRAFPEAAYAARALKLVSDRVGFPIESREQLRKGLAGERDVEFRGERLEVDETLELLPDYYFPIESPEDFLAKIADLRERAAQPDGRNVAIKWAEPGAEPRGKRPPELSHEEVLRLSGWTEHRGPGAGGLTQRGS